MYMHAHVHIIVDKIQQHQTINMFTMNCIYTYVSHSVITHIAEDACKSYRLMVARSPMCAPNSSM